jgi:putative sterol carrier protein
MGFKFLSDEFLSEAESRLNSNDAFIAAAQGQSARIQQQVSGTPLGDVSYGFVLDGGKAQIVKGEIDSPEATVAQNYETATGLQKGELTGQGAFMQGKLKITGNLMKMMQLQGVLAAMGPVLQGIDVEY